MMQRIAVLVSGSGTNLAALADACDEGRLAAGIVLAASDRECLALERARERDIATEVVGVGDFPDREAWSRRLRDVVLEREPDLVVSAGFMRILAPVFVDAFPMRLINLHPALLPAFPGAHAVRDALDFGVKVTGTTVHLIDHEVDHGPILLQEPVKVREDDTEETLHERIKVVERELLVEGCRLVLEGRVRVDGHRVRIDPPA
ncbi:MAG TPA: phosphoribosylglycinamide formyltransferase [Actinomycetota bacterium]|jgi:phosphoribosylglycinamide formyltransferase 1|nr:phosphoribosylglycinamide formyltransferase [Actinomycetota bacterium]